MTDQHPPADLDLDAEGQPILPPFLGQRRPHQLSVEADRLREEVTRLRAERDAWKELARPKGPFLSDNWRTEEMLEAENERMRAALAHYADEDNWTRSSFDLLDWYSAGPPGSHGFDVARAALQEG